jgi:PAS domain S-box-containing protein
MIWMSGPDKLCNFFNKGWFEFTGRTPAQELGNGWTDGVHREDLAHCLEIYGNAFDARQPFTMEYRLRRKDGEYRWILDSGTARTDPSGEFLGFIGSCVDITERRQAELDYQVQSTELARVGRVALMGELAASLAHEINNPVGAMVANASAGQRMIARGDVAAEELTELLADIVADGHRAREVIEGIRNLVRRTEATHTPTQIGEILRDLLRIVRADALARNIDVTMEIDPNVGCVMGDRVQLLQVFLNLTLNAFEAMSVMRVDTRQAVIRAYRNESVEVIVSVRDSGPGFPGGIAEQLFEPFFSTKSEGTGMGLAIARSIVEAHSGSLSGTNCEDGGAIFTVHLPSTEERPGNEL